MPVTTTVQNKAAYLDKVGTKLVVRDAPYTKPKSHEVLVKVHAVAINPLDWIVTSQGGMIAPWLKYPFILGTDVSGEIVETGSEVRDFNVGDRVLGHAVGFEKAFNNSTQGAFQDFVILQEGMTTRLPDQVRYEDACVVPLGLSTAACALYEADQLALPLPKADSTSGAQGQSDVVIVWGGSTSVGCNAIQLAKASGFDVIATSSPKNFQLLKKLGASQVFDYNDSRTIGQIIAAISGRKVAGAVSIGPGSAQACISILAKSSGKKRLAMVTYPGPPSEPQRFKTFQMAYYYLSGKASIALRSLSTGVSSTYVWGGTLCTNKLGGQIYGEYLSSALANGSFIPAPEAQVCGKGLDSLQQALDLQKKGVSAKKLVVTL